MIAVRIVFQSIEACSTDSLNTTKARADFLSSVGSGKISSDSQNINCQLENRRRNTDKQGPESKLAKPLRNQEIAV